MCMTVLIVDDHAGFRDAATALLEADGFRVIGQADHGARAVAEAIRLQPQLVLVDLHLPGLSGFEVAEQLALVAVPPAVVLISGHPVDPCNLARAYITGFVPKSELSGATLSELMR
jgi:DNA-binding NarL/FixJ family response regulator